MKFKYFLAVALAVVCLPALSKPVACVLVSFESGDQIVDGTCDFTLGKKGSFRLTPLKNQKVLSGVAALSLVELKIIAKSKGELLIDGNSLGVVTRDTGKYRHCWSNDSYSVCAR